MELKWDRVTLLEVELMWDRVTLLEVELMWDRVTLLEVELMWDRVTFYSPGFFLPFPASLFLVFLINFAFQSFFFFSEVVANG